MPMHVFKLDMDCTLLLLQFGIFSRVQMHDELCSAVRICA